MSMTNISITESQFKTASNRLTKTIKARTEDGKPVSHAWMLEALAQALWQKPYAEIKSTILEINSSEKTNPVTESNQAGRVHILQYGSEHLLILDGNYVTGSFPGTDLDLPVKAIESQAESLAGVHDSFVKWVYLPEVLSEEYETDDVIKLAERLGYFRYKMPLLDAIETCDKIEINGMHCPYALDGNFEHDVQFSLEEHDLEYVMENHAVWHPETTIGDRTQEYSFSLNDLGRAKELAPGLWEIGQGMSGKRFHAECLTKTTS